MDLHGWAYRGRQISDFLHEQFYSIVKYLTDSSFVEGRNWPALQKDIAQELGIAPGQVRTLKSCMEQFYILKEGSLSNNKIPDLSIFTEDGLNFVDMLNYEHQAKIEKSDDNELLEKIKQFYQFYYIKILSIPVDIGRGTKLNVLRATLKAIAKYKYLDFWEWYLLNTFIEHDDNQEEESQLEAAILQYREQPDCFKKEDIKDYQLSISYILGNIKYTGLVITEGNGTTQKVYLNPKRMEIIEKIIG